MHCPMEPHEEFIFFRLDIKKEFSSEEWQCIGTGCLGSNGFIIPGGDKGYRHGTEGRGCERGGWAGGLFLQKCPR